MQKPVIIVGGGLAGLVCARSLAGAGVPFLVLEGSEAAGGRMKTDRFEGFLLDRGFHVYFDAYPYASQVLDHDALGLGAFHKGCLVYSGGALHKVERPVGLRASLAALRDPFLTMKDKWALKSLTSTLDGYSVAVTRGLGDESAAQYLKEQGLSDDVMDKFLRPFFGGVFVDPSLDVPTSQFAFVWKMMVSGSVALPAEGIGAIPAQVAASLPSYAIRNYSRVVELLKDKKGRVTGVRLDTNEVFEASAVVLATDEPTAARLTGQPCDTETKSSTCLYFETATPCVAGAFLSVNGSAKGIVNSVAPVSSAQPSYAPPGKHLAAVTILGTRSEGEAELADRVKRELQEWFPEAGVYMWRYLRTYRIPYAQLPQKPGSSRRSVHTDVPGLFFGGEFTTNGSIDGAVEAGLKASRAVLAEVDSLVGAH